MLMIISWILHFFLSFWSFLVVVIRQMYELFLLSRLFCGLNDIYCIFLGSLNNLWALNKQYGLSKGTNEAMLVSEAYRTLRDRGPFPAHEVLKGLEGSFGFVIYDHKAGNVFVALVSSFLFLKFILINMQFLIMIVFEPVSAEHLNYFIRYLLPPTNTATS